MPKANFLVNPSVVGIVNIYDTLPHTLPAIQPHPILIHRLQKEYLGCIIHTSNDYTHMIILRVRDFSLELGASCLGFEENEVAGH